MFDSFRFINLEKYDNISKYNSSNSNHHSSTSACNIGFSCCCIYKEQRKKKTNTASKANIQPSTDYCSIRMQIILMPIYGEQKSTTSYVCKVWVGWELQTFNMSSVSIILK